MVRSHLKIALAVIVGIAICVLIVLTGPEPLEASIPEETPRVATGTLERDRVATTVSAFGVLSPRQTLQLTTQVAGEITWVSSNLDPGRQVAAGEVLFRIDERDYVNAVASAEARHAQARANVEIEKGRSEIARLEWDAWQNTQGEDLAPNPLALRAPQQAEAAARQKALRAELDQARLRLTRTSVRAPWPATVVRANAIVGQLLPVGEVTATLFPLDFAVVELQVPISTVQLIDRGVRRIDLRPVQDPNAAPVHGTIDGIVRNLTDNTRLATVRVRIDEPLRHPGWTYGMHLEAKLVTSTERAVALIPADLIVSGNLVWVHRDGRAERHQLFPIEHQGEVVQVEDNFEAADALIVKRPIGLFDGALVRADGA